MQFPRIDPIPTEDASMTEDAKPTEHASPTENTIPTKYVSQTKDASPSEDASPTKDARPTDNDINGPVSRNEHMSVNRGKPSDTDPNEYNPFAHRQIEKPISDLRSLANLVKSSLGSGILAMPLAFSNAGWVNGTICTIILAIVCAHCVHIFVQTSRGVCKLQRVPLLGYAETCKETFATGPKTLAHLAQPAFVFAEGCLIFTYIGVCCVFTVLIADSIKQPFDEYMASNIGVKYYCLIIILPLCIMAQIKHLKYLAIFSMVANFLLIMTFVLCLLYIFGEKITLHDKTAFGEWNRFPAYTSTVIFAMEGIGVVMPVENQMEKPEHFLGMPSILCGAMSLISSLYIALGLFGYLRYGNAVRGSIVLNLPITDWPAVTAKFCVALSVFLTYPLHFYVVVDILNRVIIKYISKENESIVQILIRIGIVLMCGAIAIALPLLEQVINIVGALFYSILGLIIPAVIETVHRWQKGLGKCNWILWKNAVLISFGFFSLISGCLVSIIDMVQIFRGLRSSSSR